MSTTSACLFPVVFPNYASRDRHTETERVKERERETDRQTDRQRVKERDRERERQRERTLKCQ